ncbi:hypothetical protein D3C75_1243830 [compost metagenome]
MCSVALVKADLLHLVRSAGRLRCLHEDGSGNVAIVFFWHAAFESSPVSFMYRPRDQRYASNDTRRTLFCCQRSALALFEPFVE